MDIDYPLTFGPLGRTSECTDDEHIKDLIEQVLLTSPGERVNRPTFGSGLMQLVFAPNGGSMAAATQFSVQAALHEWLGDLIEVREVEVEAVDSTLAVTIRYLKRHSGEEASAEFKVGGGP